VQDKGAGRGRGRIGIAFLAVIGPLVVLLALQYRWLVTLERTSAMAHQATLHNYLEAVTTEVQYHYRSLAERSLNLPPSVFIAGSIDKAAAFFANKSVGNNGRLFVVPLSGPGRGVPLMFDAGRGRMVPAPEAPESRAVAAAGAPWLQTVARRSRMMSTALTVDERNPRHRVVLNPITDDDAEVVGLAALVIDADHFRRSVLPAVINRSLPAFFPGDTRDNLVVTVTDGEGAVVLPISAEEGKGEAVSTAFPFVFYDWRLTLRGRHATPEQWARGNFLLNLTLSGLLAAVLLGGLTLALRTASRAVRLSQLKADFVSNVSHELRTPLASIRVFAEFLRLGRATTGDKVREYGEYIESESRRLTQLVNNILDFSRIETGRRTYRMEETDLRALVEGVLKTFEVRLRHGGFAWTLETGPGPLPPVRGDADALAQVVHNLLDNAMKYSTDTRVIALRLDRADDGVVLSVADRGIGIASGDQRRIFERFHRVAGSLVHDIRGSGLGLSIVDHVVRAHGGRVTVDSEPGRGSTFAIHLPQARPVAGAGVTMDAGAVTGDRPATGAGPAPA
jgi:signal transduction histidine kinase